MFELAIIPASIALSLVAARRLGLDRAITRMGSPPGVGKLAIGLLVGGLILVLGPSGHSGAAAPLAFGFLFAGLALLAWSSSRADRSGGAMTEAAGEPGDARRAA